MEMWQLQQMQALPLEIKIQKTKLRIKEWYDNFDGEVYVSFSGGKDSTVLLHIARQVFSDIEAVFVNTGLEYPEVVNFVKKTDNVAWLRPKMNFKEVIKKYGYPVVTKEQAHYIHMVRNTKSKHLIKKHLHGINKDGTTTKFTISKKWKYLIEAPFKISDSCCDVMKKRPIKKYEKESGKKPFLGNMANESILRQKIYMKVGCNSFDSKRQVSTPLGFWTEQDILQYIIENKIKIADCYGKIEIQKGIVQDVYEINGVRRTGCMFCMFGVHLEKGENRFQIMEKTHKKLYDYCINVLGCGKVLDYIGVEY